MIKSVTFVRLGCLSLAGGVISAAIGFERLMGFLLITAVIYSSAAAVIQKIEEIAERRP